MIDENQDTSGFYLYNTNSDSLSWAYSCVSGEDFSLYRSEKDSYSYPVNGWRWFDSIEKAHEFYGIKILEINR